MSKLPRRALILFSLYAVILVAVVVAGFLGEALGIWAAILWGVGIIAGLAIYGRQRLTQSRGT